MLCPERSTINGGIGNYEKKLFIRPEWQGKRLFLRFEGANSIADVFINRRHIGEHRGGYGAFVFEITGEVNYGKNSILVRVNNGGTTGRDAFGG